jgi:hypothetical protein
MASSDLEGCHQGFSSLGETKKIMRMISGMRLLHFASSNTIQTKLLRLAILNSNQLKNTTTLVSLWSLPTELRRPFKSELTGATQPDIHCVPR